MEPPIMFMVALLKAFLCIPRVVRRC